MVKKYTLKTPASTLGATLKIPYQEELNTEQLQVVVSDTRAGLVLAGAGSGKTRTLIYRVSYLLEKGVNPKNILLVTFTNKAAHQMRDRVERLLKDSVAGLWCGTFHHIANRLLRMYGSAIGLKSDFGILDEEDSRDLIKACAKSLNLSDAQARFPKPGILSSIISYSANSGKTVSQTILSSYPYLREFVGSIEKVRILYEEKKWKTSNLDYDDLLLYWLKLLNDSPDVLEKLQKQFHYILVDEYQDTNFIQQAIIKKMAGESARVLVVGDDAQSIYSFRAADVKNILDFPEHYSQSQIFKLETNYRSTSAILDLANHSIAHNVHQFPKKLKSVRGGGAVPQYAKLRDARQEAQFVAQRIEDMLSEGISLGEVAVLFRARFQAAELELELAKRGYPYVIRGGVRFFEQAHIKDCLAYLRMIVNPSDEISWVRALTLHPGIGAGYATRIYELAAKSSNPMVSASTSEFASNFPPKVRQGLEVFRKTLSGILKDSIADKPDMLIEQILEQGYNKYVLMNFDNAKDRLEDLRELVNFAHSYKTLREFVADATLKEGFKGESVSQDSSSTGTAEEMLVLSTIHQAKGLEWQSVFVIGLSEGLFPHAKSMESEDQLEEERRLFYVATTRAKDQLTLTHPMTRFDYSAGMVLQRPSIFISELPMLLYEELEIEEDSSENEDIIYLDE